MPVMIVVAVVLSVSLPSDAVRGSHHTGQLSGNAVAMDHNGMADHKKSANHKKHALCSPGAGCFAFTHENTVPTVHVRAPHVINPLLIVELSTRSIIPPLPPPITFIIA